MAAHGGCEGGGGATGFSLQLRRESGEESKFDDIKALQEAAIQVEFILPDDSTATHEFRKGQTVQVLKSFLEAEYELPQTDVKLYFQDKVMLDPFSLTDFDGVENARSIQISVRVDRGSDVQRK